MEALEYFLILHRQAHKAGKAWRVLEVPATPDAWRVTLPNHNSIAWCLWHCAQTEDWGISALRGDDMLVRRDGWEERLRFAWPTFGMGMTAADVAHLSKTIDLEAVRGYYDAVYEETRRFISGFEFDTLQTPRGEELRRHALDLVGGDELMRAFLEPRLWLIPGTYINVCAVMDVYYHVDEAEHMLHLVHPDGQFV